MYTLVLSALFATAAGLSAEPAVDHLPRPFTAEQIREAFQPGLYLVMRTTTGEVQTFQRWTVVSADQETVQIEFTAVDANGEPTAEPTVASSTWVELRNHATFPKAIAERSDVSAAKTALGQFDGWLYSVSTPADENGQTDEVTTLFFFAKDLPGAPLDMIVSTNGVQTTRVEMIERSSVDEE